MKKSKLFRRSTLLFAIIALAVVLTVGVIAGVSMANEEPEATADYGETYAAVNVATSGKVSLKFYYSTVGTATGFVAEIIDPTGETAAKTIEYAVEDLVQTANGYCVEVPLAPSQMTYTVKVYANGAEGYGTPITYSVREYALDVLADETLAEHHDAMRALLNWGAMAQTKFADATSVPANTGIFERNSNSIHGMNTISYNSGAVTQGSTITGAEMNLSLEPNNTVIHFYVNYTGNGTLTATVSKDGAEAVDTAITQTEKGWLVRIGNVPASLYDTPYTVTVTDGTDTFTATKTVREYLGVLLAQCNANSDSATGNTVRAMYQLYQFVNGKTGGECAHGDKNAVYWIAAGADTQVIRCTLCHAELSHQAINSGVNAYATPNTIKQHVTYTGKADATLGTDPDGTQFIRFDNYYSNRDNWGDISIGAAFAGVTTGSTGQYMVIKYRVSAEGNSKTVFETYVNTNKGGENNLTGKGMTNIVMSKDDQWHTVIINLAERVRDPSVTFVDEGDGTYYVRYLSIRAFANGTKVEDDSEEGHYAYTYLDANGAKWTVYGEKLTEEQMAEKGYTELAQINKTSVSPDAYFDLAYVALCDSYDEAKSLIDSATYEKSVANDTSYILNTADDSCAPHAFDGVEVVEGNTYSYKCLQCGEALYSKTVPASVAAFISPYTMSTTVQTAENDKLTPNTHYQMTSKAFALDGIPYFGFNGTAASNKTVQFIWMRSAQDVASASAHERWQLDIDQSKYLVIKARGNAGALEDVVFVLSTSGRTGSKTVKLPLSAAGADEWGVYVVDLSKVLADYHVKNTETDTYELDCFYFHISTFETTDRVELGYIAFVEDWADVDAIVEETTFYNLTDTIGNYVELNTADHTCLGEHTKGSMQNIDGVYKFPCTVCGTILRDTGVSADAVNALWPAETLYIKAAQTGTSASGWSSIQGSYAQKELITENGVTFLRIGDASSGGSGWHGWFPISTDGNNSVTNAGRYMVMKVRNNKSTGAWNTIPFWITSKASSAGSWAAGSFTVVLPQDDQWHTIVVDLAARCGEYIANGDGTYDLKTMHLRPLSGNNTSLDSTTDESFDIAYMAFFDDLNDIKNIIDTDTYDLSVDNSSNALLKTEDNTCVAHAATETVDGTTHTIKCTICGKVIRTFEVSADINWYAPLSGMNKFQHTMEKLLLDEEEGVMFNRYTGTGGNHINITGGGGAGSATSGTFPTGKYVAIKYRLWVAGGASATGTFGFNVATGDKKDGNGASMGTLNYTTIEQGEWRVAFIDVSGNAEWTSDGTAQSIYMMITTAGSGAYTFDVAWVAVVDSVNEMKTLLKEGETYYDLGANWASAGTEYNQDGTKVPCKTCQFPSAATVTDGENGAKIYTYACLACENAIFTKTVPAGVVYMSPEVLNTNKAATIVNPNAESANSPEVYAEKTGLNPTTKYQHKNGAYGYDTVPFYGYKGGGSGNVSQFIWNRAYSDYTGNAPSTDRYLMDMGESRFLVFKLRTNLADANSAFDISISTTGASGKTIKLPIYANQTDGWVTYVVDLEAVIPDNWVKDETSGHYIMDSFYYTNYSFTADNSIDIAYIAFVAGDWSDVDAFVDEDTVVNVLGSTDFTYDIRYADGTLLGTKPEEPVDVTFDEGGMATVTVPAKTTMYFSTWMLSGEMSLLANGEALEFVAGMPRMTPSTFSITNDGEEAMEYYLCAEYPTGHMNNPAGLWAGEDTVVEIPEGCQGYFFTYEAYATGTLTLKFSATTGWTYTINNLTAGTYGDMQYSDSDPVVDTVVIEVKSGEVYQIIVNTYDPDSWTAPAGTVTVSAELEIPYGSEYNPVQLGEDITVTIPAGATYHFSSRANGATLIVNGEDKGVIVADMWTPYTFTITNEGDADAEYVFEIVFPEGTMDNPKEIVLGENSVDIAEGAEPYYFTWTATAAGEFTITVSANTGWFYVVNNMTSGQYGDMQWSDSEPVLATCIVEVEEGDVLEIQVNTYDPANMWANPAGTVTVNAAFE